MTKRRLGELLQAEGLVSEDQIRAALEEQRKSNLFLGEALVKLGFVTEEVIAQTIVQQFNLPFASALQFHVTPEVLNIFPERMYYEYQFLACDKIGKVLVIVGAGLMNHDVLDELERCSGCKVHQFVSTWKDIRTAIEKYAKDFKKEQSELTSLGTMLLDMTPQPDSAPAAAPLSAAKAAPPPPAAVPPAPAPVPSFMKNAGKSGAAAAVNGPPKPPAPPAPGFATKAGSGSAPAVASNVFNKPPSVAPASASSMFKATQTPVPPLPSGPLGAKPPAAISGMNQQVPASKSSAGSQKLSALAGFKPANAAPAAPPADKNETPAPAGQVKTGSPPAPKSGTGLLGLFKKS